MRLYTLVEYTQPTRHSAVQHGLSFYLETEREHLLFDLGQSELFFCATRTRWGWTLPVLTARLFHGHYDHGGGLAAFLRENDHAPVYVHSRAFQPAFFTQTRGCAFHWFELDLAHHPRLVPTGDVYGGEPQSAAVFRRDRHRMPV